MRPTTTIANVLLAVALLVASAAASTEQKLNQKKLTSREEPQQAVKQVKEEVQATGEAASVAAAPKEESEYLQIKPEEVGLDAGPKAELLSISDNVRAPDSVEQQSSVADEKLSSHLAQDVISPQESSYRPYAALEPNRQAARYSGPRPTGLYGGPGATLKRPPPRHSRQPPSYMPLKGKLTGFNTLVSQYPHPMPGYPHQGPRHLPRGAAAGFAAFRDYVRAHAHNYKQPQLLPPLAPPAPPASHPAPAVIPVGPAPVYPPQSQLPKKTKVSVAKAYIPHIARPVSAPASIDSYAVNPAANVPPTPYGASPYRPVPTSGRPEYNKDFGMVIHYPQATVYTEPMSVEQLHKLTGTGISQILQHLQYQLATGHRDETNTIQGGSKHHIGQGLSIQAKDYYAPSKSGHYVHTTAAVIAGPEEQQTSQYQQIPSSGSYGNLGPGYERVRQAVEASQNRPKQPLDHYEPSAATSNGYRSAPIEGLGPMTSLIASELENLYGRQKQQQLQSPRYPTASSSFRYRLPGGYQPQTQLAGKHQQQRLQRLKQRLPRRGTRQLNAIRQLKRPASLIQQAAYQAAEFPAPQHQRPPAYFSGQAAQQQRYRQQQQQQQQQYLQNCQKAEQALDKQMNQLLHELQSGDEQYDAKEQQGRPINQGYPHKIIQKYQQKQQRPAGSYNKNKASTGYASHEGVEFVHGANDQVGEISDLMEALRSSLELHKPTDYQQQQLDDDVKYLAGALGQQPSYAIQVPVAPNAAAAAAVSGYELPTGPVKADAYQQQQVSHYNQVPQVQAQSTYQQQPALVPQQPVEQYLKAQPEVNQQTYVTAGQQAEYAKVPQPQQEKPNQYAVLAPNVVSGPSYSVLQNQQLAIEVPTQKQSTYTSSHIINHLVPVAPAIVASPEQQPASPIYVESSIPAQAVAPAPTPAPVALIEPQFQQQQQQQQQNQYQLQQQQYQQQLAQYQHQQQQQQPLNAYVDSLAAEYQEILRQPPVLLEPGQQFQQPQQQLQQVQVQEQSFQTNNSTSSSSSSTSTNFFQQQLNLTTQTPIQQQVISTSGFKGIQQELDGQF